MKIGSLRRLNETYSESFCQAHVGRNFYRNKHRTKVCVSKCMDGRLHIPHATKTPLGIIKSFRNIGGDFNLGWSYLSSVIDEFIEYALAEGSKVLFLLTYHYSRGDHHRGCAGHDYDTDKAFESVMVFKEQLERVYGSDHDVVCPVLCGFETDLDALILHGDMGEIVDLAEVNDSSQSNVDSLLANLFQKMPKDILRDFAPLVQGNIEHIAEVKAHGRPIIDVQHKESVLAVGRGFDWFHKPNEALIIGPYQPNLDDAIRKGLGIIKSNLEQGRILMEEGVVTLASATFANPCVKRRRAIERAKFLSEMIMGIVDDDFPELKEFIHPLAVVTDLNTQRFEEV